MLDFDRLAQIQRASSVPLALHGGSGTPFEQLQRCPEFGVAKINVGAAVFEAGKRRCCTPCATTAPLSWPMRYR
jgi:fructose-bisphosphate aldolase class II